MRIDDVTKGGWSKVHSFNFSCLFDYLKLKLESYFKVLSHI